MDDLALIERVATGRASGIKMGDDGGGLLISPDGVAPSRMVGASAFDIFPCTIKSRRFLLASAHPGSPGEKAVKQLFMCVSNDPSLFLCVLECSMVE